MNLLIFGQNRRIYRMKSPFCHSLALLAAALVLAGCGNNQGSSSQTNSASTGAVPAPSGNYLDTLANSRDRAVKVIDTASLTQAVQMFNATEGRFPKDLEELVTNKLIAEIPVTPRGKKLDYNPATGEVKLVDE
jgi:ABC-type glycerol-3-phosphate transport system substrate-binding protein